jgi:hypothetical protein
VPHDLAVAAAVIAARGAAERGDEVFGAPHERDDFAPSREIPGVEDAGRRLTQRDHLEPRHGGQRRVGLRDHDAAIRRRLERGEVGREVGGRRRIHPHHHSRRVEGMLRERHACGLLVGCGDGVLEIEDDGIRPVERLRVPVRAVRGAEQQRGPQ